MQDSESETGKVNFYFIFGSNVFAGNSAQEITGTPSPASMPNNEQIMNIINMIRQSNQ